MASLKSLQSPSQGEKPSTSLSDSLDGVTPSQSLSRPSQTSAWPGFTLALVSSQSPSQIW